MGSVIERSIECVDAAVARLRPLPAWARKLARRACRQEPLPSRPLVVVAAALAIGCCLPAVTPAPAVAWWIAAAVCLAAWGWLAGRGRPERAALALCLAIACSGSSWSVARGRLFDAADLAWGLMETPVPVAIEGTVAESARPLPPPATGGLRGPAPTQSSECLVDVRAVRDGDRWRPAGGRAAVIVDGEPPSLVAGSHVRILGRGVRPASPLNPGEFDFRERSRALRCLSIVRCHSRECIALLAGPHPLSPSAAIDRLRSAGMAVLRRHLSAASAPLASALLLGGRESLPREDSREFLVTGTIHILSISGLHVGLLALALFRLLRTIAVPRCWSLVAVAACTGLYMLLVRAETPVVRATLLVWLSCLAAAVGRRSPAINGLAAAAVVVLVWHPPELFRIGTQLSFLSTAVLVGVASTLAARRMIDDPIERLIDRSRPLLERWLRRQAGQLGEIVVAGGVIWAVTAPVVASSFHLVSPVGLVLNPLVAPLVGLAMGCGFLCLAAAPCSGWLAGLFGRGCDAALAGIGWMVGAAADVPGGHIWVAGPPAWWVAGWYALIAATLLALPRARLARPSTWVVVAAAWIAVGAGAWLLAAVLVPAPPAVRAVIAAMGHGCGIVVRGPQGRCLVYDAGRLGAAGAAERAMAAVLWSEGVDRIDTLVISHADADHFNAVPELLERFTVGEIVVSPAFLASPAAGVAQLLRRAREAGVPVRAVTAQDPAASIGFEPLCRVRVLHPPEGDPAGPVDDNQTSIVLAIDAAGRRLLLTGDLEGEAMGRLVASHPAGCDVLVAPHHGSRTSLPPDLARATAPDWVVASGAGGPAWEEVRAAYEHARTDGGRSTVLKTGGDGAVAITLTSGGARVERFSRGRWQAVAPAPAGPSPSATATLRPRGARSSR